LWVKEVPVWGNGRDVSPGEALIQIELGSEHAKIRGETKAAKGNIAFG